MIDFLNLFITFNIENKNKILGSTSSLIIPQVSVSSL